MAAVIDEMVVGLHEDIIDPVPRDNHPHEESVYGLMFGLMIPRTDRKFFEKYAKLCQDIANEEVKIFGNKCLFLYQTKYLHITNSPLISFKSKLSELLTYHAKDSEQVKEQKKRTRDALLREWQSALATTFASIGVRDFEDSLNDDHNNGTSEHESKRRKATDAPSSSQLLNHVYGTNSNCDLQKFDVVLQTPRISRAAAFFWGVNDNGELATVRQAVREASTQFFNAVARAREASPEDYESLNGVEVNVESTHFAIPNIIHSSFLRFVNQPTNSWEFIETKFNELVGGKWEDHTIVFDRFHIFLEDRPFLHIPKDASHLIGAYGIDGSRKQS